MLSIKAFSHGIAALAAAGCLWTISAADFGKDAEDMLVSQSTKYFGIIAPITGPATASTVVARDKAEANQRVRLATGLDARFVTRKIGTDADMIALWPDDDNPTHLIVCIESGRNSGGTNYGVQRVSLTQDLVETIVYGTDRCDGIRRTAWGTILFTEESDTGRAWELLNPLNTTNQWIQDRATGVVRTTVNGSVPSSNIVLRAALPTMAWEGLEVLPTGVVYGGDELRPGTAALDVDGGAMFKFVPSNPRSATGAIGNLADSPLAAGKTYALTVSCQGGTSNPQMGQGCEIGNGVWVNVDPLTARTAANANKATGYYRPEDLHLDPIYKGTGVRFCWTNTGNEGGKNYGEVVCAVDNNPTPKAANEWLDTRTNLRYLTDGGTGRTAMTLVEVNRFVEGDTRFNSVDNLAFQPKSGILYVIEDHDFGEVFACLPDGADRDIKSDGCISILSVIDPNAEPTGFIFSGDGTRAWVNIQHGQDFQSLRDANNQPTDDLIEIRGFRIP